MIKKIYFQSIFFSFLFFKEAFAAENGGMPQLNPEFWISQIFWLILTFGILYLVLSKLILPKISNNLESRKSQILENIETAEKPRKDSDAKLKEYDEIISYLSRPISLSVRLFANMMAGHTMMKVFGGFVISLGLVGGWLPLSFSVALTGLEILVAFLQAYVFAILTCIYLNDALNLHH